jgi:hypothetical protein
LESKPAVPESKPAPTSSNRELVAKIEILRPHNLFKCRG